MREQQMDLAPVSDDESLLQMGPRESLAEKIVATICEWEDKVRSVRRSKLEEIRSVRYSKLENRRVRIEDKITYHQRSLDEKLDSLGSHWFTNKNLSDAERWELDRMTKKRIRYLGAPLVTFFSLVLCVNAYISYFSGIYMSSFLFTSSYWGILFFGLYRGLYFLENDHESATIITAFAFVVNIILHVILFAIFEDGSMLYDNLLVRFLLLAPQVLASSFIPILFSLSRKTSGGILEHMWSGLCLGFHNWRLKRLTGI